MLLVKKIASYFTAKRQGSCTFAAKTPPASPVYGGRFVRKNAPGAPWKGAGLQWEEVIPPGNYRSSRKQARQAYRQRYDLKPLRKGREKVTGVCTKISEMTCQQHGWKPVEMIVAEMNSLLRGWGNYFSLGSVSRAYQCVNNHARHRLRQWLNGKYRSRGYYAMRHPAAYLHLQLGLVQLTPPGANFSRAKT